MGMTVRREQLRMVERRGLAHRAWIGQPIAQEINQVRLVLQRQTKNVNVGIHVLVLFAERIEVSAAIVELDHLFQSQLAAIVEIGSGESDVAQLRRFEKAATSDVVTAVQWRHGNTIARTPRDHVYL